MPNRRVVAMLLLLGGVLAVQAPFSSATYTGGSTTPWTVTAANDWTPPTVSVTNPGTVVNGTVTVSATAADDRSAVSSVVIESSAGGSGTWTTLCTDASSPYSCSWATTSVADDAYQLRSRATDTVGLTATSAAVSTRVANNVAVALSESAGPVRGTVPLTATVSNAPGSVISSLRIQYLDSSSTWVTIAGCSNTSSTTLSCSWVTTGADTYDVRAIVVVGSATYTDVASYEVDNVAPTVVMTVPAGTLRGSVALTATAGDVDTAVETVLFEFRKVGVTAWTTCGTDPTAPFACQLATTGLSTGNYDFRATATDSAGNTAVSATVTRAVDNTVASTSITSPASGATVRGTVNVTAAATAGSGKSVSSVRIEARPAGGSFLEVCTDTSSPYSCSADTTGVDSGQYEVRSVMTQNDGSTVTSATVIVNVDNIVLRAVDVQATSSGTAGKANPGDTITFTYSTLVDLGTIKTGFTGSSTPLTANLRDRVQTGTNSDRFEFGGANLGQVAFIQDYVRSNKATAFDATMTATTATVGGGQVSVVTVTLGSITNGSANLQSTTNTTGWMLWTPSALAKSMFGVACSTAVATESGNGDKDL